MTRDKQRDERGRFSMKSRLLSPVKGLQTGSGYKFMVVSELVIASMLIGGFAYQVSPLYQVTATGVQAEVDVTVLTDQQIIEAIRHNVKMSEYFAQSLVEAENMVLEFGVNSKLETYKDLQHYNPNRTIEEMNAEGEMYSKRLRNEQ